MKESNLRTEQPKKTGNFFTNLLESLFGGNDPESIKRRKLASIAKQFSKTKSAKFYKYSNNEAEPLMARCFFEIYKTVYPARTMFQNTQNPNIFKRLCVDYFTPKQIRELEDSLSEQSIIAQSSQVPTEKLKKESLDKVSQYSDFFNVETVSKINNLYNALMAFKDFCMFDYYVLLRKFYKPLKEGDFTSTPQFARVGGEMIVNDIKDFIGVMEGISPDTDYSNMIKLLRAYRTVEPVTAGNWNKVVKRIAGFKMQGTFDTLVKLMTLNPDATVSARVKSENIVEPYLDKFKSGVEETLRHLVNRERDQKAGVISNELFAGIAQNPLKHYTKELNDTFTQKGLRTFDNTEALSYLKTFLLEIFKKDIREYYELILVRGQWESVALSKSFSEAYNNLLGLSDEIIKFDGTLAEDAQVGMKIKTHLPKTARDNGAKNIVNRLIEVANDDAYKFITTGMNNLINIGKTIKEIIEDADKKKPLLIKNYSELEHYANTPIKPMSVKIYKKIYLLSNLVKTCLATH